MKVAILFPNTESSRFLSTRLLENGYEVLYFCPDKLDIDFAQNHIFELNIVGREQDIQRQKEKSFSVEKNDLSDCEIMGELHVFIYLKIIFVTAQLYLNSTWHELGDAINFSLQWTFLEDSYLSCKEKLLYAF